MEVSGIACISLSLFYFLSCRSLYRNVPDSISLHIYDSETTMVDMLVAPC